MSLPRLLEGWSNRPAIRAALVVDADGLPVHEMLHEGQDGEAVAALAVTLLRHGEQLGDAGRANVLRNVVLDYSGGPAILTPLDERHTLVVFAEPDQDLGPLLFEIRQSRKTLSGAL